MVVGLQVAQRGALAELPGVKIEAVFVQLGSALLLARVQGGGSLFDGSGFVLRRLWFISLGRFF
jgi:hypothetical protein